MGVVHPVEDDEAGIDRLVLALARDDGAGMAAKAPLGFVEHDRVGFRQQMRRGHPGNAPPDDSNAAGGVARGSRTAFSDFPHVVA